MPENRTHSVRDSSAAPVLAGRPPPEVLGLCLSGGGFRATYFHFGVVSFFKWLGWLRHLKYVTAVSAGSILAAHMLSNWNAYSTEHDTWGFATARSALVGFGQKNHRGSRLWTKGRTRTNDLQAQLRDLLPGDIGGLPHTPELRILATEFSTGELCAFSRDGYERGAQSFSLSGFPLARAVTASAAYPPGFEPVAVDWTSIGVSKTAWGKAVPDQLTDGGVYDNLGTAKMRQLAEGEPQFAVIVSDASAPADWGVGSKPRWVVSRAKRGVKLLIRRVGELDRQVMEYWKRNIQVYYIPIGTIVEHPWCGQEVRKQQEQQYVRTDLSDFSKHIRPLAVHGYEAAAQVFFGATTPPNPFAPYLLHHVIFAPPWPSEDPRVDLSSAATYQDTWEDGVLQVRRQEFLKLPADTSRC